MKIARYTPSLNLSHMADFNPFFRQPMAAFPSVAQLFEEFLPSSPSARLHTDFFEDDAHFYARFEVPGVKKEAVKVELQEGVLSISAERHEKRGEMDSSHTLSRSIALPEAIHEDAISAKLEDGILTVTLPKQEPRKPKSISIL